VKTTGAQLFQYNYYQRRPKESDSQRPNMTTHKLLVLHSLKTYPWITASMSSTNLSIIISMHCGISVPPYIWRHSQNGSLCACWLSPRLYKLCFIRYHSEKTYINSRKHRTSLHMQNILVPFSPVTACWRRGVVVTALVLSTKLLYVKPG